MIEAVTRHFFFKSVHGVQEESICSYIYDRVQNVRHGYSKVLFLIFLGVRMVVSFTEILLFGLGNNGCLDVASVKKRIENVGKYYKFVSVFGNILQNSYPLVI